LTEGEDAVSSDEDDLTSTLGSFDSVLPAMSRNETEHQTPDPTGCPETQQENHSSAEETMESGESYENRYGLRSEQGEAAGAPDTAQAEIDEGRIDAEITGTEPFTNADIERGVKEGERGSPPYI
jgi:hypothetical protein